MSQLRALDLCCGAGGAGAGLARWFAVTGVDLHPQPRYPFPFIQADALTFLADLNPADWDFIWASFPCQAFSTVTGKYRGNHPDLITPGRTLLQATGLPWIMENVGGAPLRNAVMLCGQQFGLKVFRHRFFESNTLLLVPPHPRHDGSTGSHRWPYTPVNGYVQVTGNGGNFTLAAASAAMGIDWMDKPGIAEAIPPAYSEYLGRQVAAALTNRRAA